MSQSHFTIKERESIFKFIALGYTQTKMSNQLSKNKSSISREIKRNSINGEYSPHQAQTLYQHRKSRCGANKKLKDSILLPIIQEELEKGWSPEQISGRAMVQGLFSLSFKTIYNAIASNLLLPNSHKFLTRKGKNKAVLAINNRPRKCLGFKTPLEVFGDESNLSFNLTM
jgi:IS30 family transposase